jgi:hypothetical protein
LRPVIRPIFNFFGGRCWLYTKARYKCPCRSDKEARTASSIDWSDYAVDNDMTQTDFLALDDAALLAQCEVDTYRASGPGGQKRNKTSSAVRLRHGPTGTLVTAVESRSQHENKYRALLRLRKAIALQVRRHVDLEQFGPSPLLRSCISGADKIVVGRRDHRYNAAVQEILDLFWATGAQMSTTAERLGVNTAGLSHFCREDPALWRRVNELRGAAGLGALK